MEVNPYDGASYFGVKPVKPKSELNSEMFMRLLTVQLMHQNPMEPMNDRDFFAQMAQLGTVEGLGKVQKSLDIAQASNLMGKKVTAVRPMTESSSGSNELVVGVAKTLTLRNGEYYLGLQEPNGGLVEVKMAAVQKVEMQ